VGRTAQNVSTDATTEGRPWLQALMGAVRTAQGGGCSMGKQSEPVWTAQRNAAALLAHLEAVAAAAGLFLYE